MKITTIDVRGKKFDVDVNEGGSFGTSYKNEWINASSLEDLRGKLLRITKAEQAKLSIGFIEWDGKKMRHGVCTGKHGANRNFLVKYDDKKSSEQVIAWDLEHAIDPVEELHYTKLCLEFERAKLARDTFEKQHRVEVKKIVEKAIEDAESEPE